MSDQNQYSFYLFGINIWYLIKLNLTFSLLSFPFLIILFLVQVSSTMSLLHILLFALLFILNAGPVFLSITNVMVTNNQKEKDGLSVFNLTWQILKTNYTSYISKNLFWGILILLILLYRLILGSSSSLLIGILDFSFGLLIVFFVQYSVYCNLNKEQTLKQQLIDSFIFTLSHFKIFLVNLLLLAVLAFLHLIIPLATIVFFISVYLIITFKMMHPHLRED